MRKTLETLYTMLQWFVVPGLSLLYKIVAKKFIKMKPADPGKLESEDLAKLVVSVTLAMWTWDCLLRDEHIPADTIK